MLLYNLRRQSVSNIWNIVDPSANIRRKKVRNQSCPGVVIDYAPICRWTVSEHGTIVQTNIDHWSSAQNEDILFSIRRRALSRQLLNEMNQLNEVELWKV